MNCPSAQQATLDGYRTEQRTEQELTWAYRAAGRGKGSVVLAMSGGYPLPQAREGEQQGGTGVLNTVWYSLQRNHVWNAETLQE